MEFIKKNNWIIMIIIFSIIIFAIVSTSARPEGDLADTRDKNHVDFIKQGDIEKKELSEEDKLKLQVWHESGFIAKMDQFSHEVWVNEKEWYQLDDAEKYSRILTISNFYKDFDGTSQVAIFRDTGEQKLVAEYIARKFRFYDK